MRMVCRTCTALIALTMMGCNSSVVPTPVARWEASDCDCQTAIDLASRERFLREAAVQLQRERPALTDALGPEELCRRLTIFAREAHNLGFVREDDARHYLRLRLQQLATPV